MALKKEKAKGGPPMAYIPFSGMDLRVTFSKIGEAKVEHFSIS
jgi:hypothetical protein